MIHVSQDSLRPNERAGTKKYCKKNLSYIDPFDNCASSIFQTFRRAWVSNVSAKLTILKLTAEAVLHHKQAILPRSVTQRRSNFFVTFHLSKCYVCTVQWQQFFFQMHFAAWAINKEISLRSISRFFFGLEPRYSIVVVYTVFEKF